MISYVKRIFKNLKKRKDNKNEPKVNFKSDYIEYTKNDQKEFAKYGLNMNIDEETGSYIIYTKPTIENLLDELSKLSNANVVDLVEMLYGYIDIVDEYDISFTLKYDQNVPQHVFKTIFPKEMIINDFVPVIGNKGICVINKYTLKHVDKEPKIFDYSIQLDNNIVSYMERHFSLSTNEELADNFKFFENNKLNFDIFPYLVEQLVRGYEKCGKDFKLNEKDPSQKGIFQNLRIIHQNLRFEVNEEEEFIKNLVTKFTKNETYALFRYYNINKLFLIYLLEARELYSSKQVRKRKEHILNKLTENNAPVGVRLLKLLNLFFKDDSYEFFKKVRSTNKMSKITFSDNISNTARDMLICTLPSIFNKENYFPVLYTHDKGLRETYKDLQPDLILNIGNQSSEHIYIDVIKEYHHNKKFAHYFSEENKMKRIKQASYKHHLFSSKVKKAEANLIELLGI